METVRNDEVAAVQERLVELADLVHETVRDAIAACSEVNVTLAEKVVSCDKTVDLRAEELDELTVRILTRQTPVVGDMRIIVAALRATARLERMAELARHIAELARQRFPERIAPESLRGTFVQMGAQVVHAAEELAMLLHTQDLVVGELLIEDDHWTDFLQRRALDEVAAPEWAHGGAETMDVVLAARYLERIGDQTVAIAKMMRFVSTGEWAPDEH